MANKNDLPATDEGLSMELKQLGFPDLPSRHLKNYAEVASVTRTSGEVVSVRTNVNAPSDRPIGKARRYCTDERLIEVFGRGRTGEDGTVTLSLSDFLCRSSDRRFLEPAFAVATARTGRCVIMTISTIVEDDEEDLLLKVESWDPDGNPRPETSFDWVCRAAFYHFIG